MKYFIFLILFLPALANGQNSLTFKAHLIDFTEDKIPAGCGFVIYATTLKFQLSENIGRFYKGQTIVLVIPCPRELGMNFYENNREYCITFKSHNEYANTFKEKETTKNMTIIENYRNEVCRRIWCDNIEIIK